MADISSPDWASLPGDLVDLILSKLIGLSDFVRFGAVCKSWLSSSLLQKHLRIANPNPNQIPFLIVPSTSSTQWWKLYNVIDCKTIRNFGQHLPHHNYTYERFCGSSHGWLAAMKSGGNLILINPFSSDSASNTISLPPLCYKYSEYCWDNVRDYEVKKVILSCDPYLHPNDYVVVVHYSNPGKLAYIKPSRDQSWTPIETRPTKSSIRDVIYYENRIYVLGYSGRLESIDIEDGNRATVVIDKPTLVEDHIRYYIIHEYIVEASDGGLLLVRRVDDRRKANKNFYIFRLTAMLEADGCFEWVEIEGLVGETLFLGDYSGVCVVASNFPGCQSNCIYYSPSYGMQEFTCFGRLDVGIYSLADHDSFRNLYKRPSKLKLSSSSCIWILPKLQ